MSSAAPSLPQGGFHDVGTVGLVGCGRWGRNILRDLIGLGARVAVADADPRVQADARALGAGTVASAVDALPPVAGAIVATPTVTHAAVIEALLTRDVPIFCEKPLCADADTAARLAARAGDHLFVMDKWRYHPAIEWLRDVVRAGALGRLRSVRTVRHGWANPHTDVDAVWILAPHDLTIALEVLGTLPPPRCAVGEWAGHDLVGLWGVLGADPMVVVDVSSVAATPRREVRICGERGTAVMPDAHSDHVLVWRGGAAPERHVLSTDAPLRRELHAFLTHLAGGAPPKSSAAEGVAVVRTLQALRAAAGADRAGRA